MAFRYFAYNTGSTIPNTSQVGNIAVFDGGSSVAKTVKWWSGPLEQNGYIIATVNPDGNQPNPDNQPAFISFLSTIGFQEQDFINLAQTLIGGTYTSGLQAKSALLSSGIWSSFPDGLGYLGTSQQTSYFIKNTGRLWGWGYNGFGAIGSGGVAASEKTPVSLGGRVKTFCVISGAWNGASSSAIDKYGQVWVWGLNSNGQLGTNSTVSSTTPRSICGTKKTFCKVLMHNSTARGLDNYGQAWSWGSALQGSLGNNSLVNVSTPVSVCGTKKTFCQIANIDTASICIDNYGQAWGWGYNLRGQLGNNSTTSRLTPVSICGTKKTFCKITAGDAFILSIDKYGQIWSWGNNNSGQLGDATNNSRSTPVSVRGSKKTFCQISAGRYHSVGIDKYGQVWTWGDSVSSQLGQNSFSNIFTPKRISGVNKTFCGISSGTSFTIALEHNGRIWGWGYGGRGQLGNNTTMNVCTPVSVKGAKKTFCSVGNALNNGGSIDKNGQAWVWGRRTNFALGDAQQIGSEFTPVKVGGQMKTFCTINGGNDCFNAIDKNGQIWSWGYNTSGNLGDNGTFNKQTPFKICGINKTFCKVVQSGSLYAISIDKYGQIWTWGNNSAGALGDNTIVSKRTPISICGSKKTFCEITAGRAAFGLDIYGQAWGWGNGGYGAIGNNSTSNQSTPVSVCGSKKTFCKIDNYSHTLAIDKYGQIWGWGRNINGQLGNLSTQSVFTPVSVRGTKKTFCKISTGDDFSLAIDNYGRGWGWGRNGYGQLGDNSLTNKCTPVMIYNSNKTFCDISCARYGATAIDNQGVLWGWGQVINGVNPGGQTILALTPVRVCNF